jgi:hypothetical protein
MIFRLFRVWQGNDQNVLHVALSVSIRKPALRSTFQRRSEARSPLGGTLPLSSAKQRTRT